MALLGIDLGTSSVKVLVLDPDGRTLGVGKAAYAVQRPQPTWAESDPAAWWQATVEATQEALAHTPATQITAIGLAGQMHGVVLTDAVGQPTRPAMLWADSRATDEVARFQALPAATRQRLANPLVPGMAGPLLCWVAAHEPTTYAAVRWALQPKDWLRWQLTGTFATDPSDASATLLYDVPGDDWAEDVIAALGLRRELLPPILPTMAIAGSLTAQVAQALGLPAGLPVATGAADTAAAALGAGLLTPGLSQLALGTGAQIIQLVDAPIVDPTWRTHLFRAADGTHWYRMAAMQNGGMALDWVRQILGASWAELFASATDDGAEDLFFLPDLIPERTRMPWFASGGAWLGLRLAHRRTDLLQSALAGVAFRLKMALALLPEVNPTAPLRLVGGGSVHPAWRQLLADTLGHALAAVEEADASARGAALLAGIAVGMWPDAQATAAIAPQTHIVATPDPVRAAWFQERYARYRAYVL
jgi:xylulokinase